MRLFPLGSFVVALLISSGAFARDAKLGNSTISVSPPAGFCEVDNANRTDSTWLESVTNLLKGSGIHTVAAFPDCSDLQKARKTGQFIVSKVYVSAPFSLIDQLKPDSVEKTCEDLHTREFTEKDKAETDKVIKEFANGNTGLENKTLGVLDETKGAVCFVAMLHKVKTKEGDISTMIDVFAVTSAKSSMIFIYQFTPYVDASSIPTALANSKIIYSDFARANK